MSKLYVRHLLLKIYYGGNISVNFYTYNLNTVVTDMFDKQGSIEDLSFWVEEEGHKLRGGGGGGCP